MSPRRASRVLRYTLRRIECRDAEELARDALACSGIPETRQRRAAFARQASPPAEDHPGAG